jgi:hypothetical protein
VSKRSTPLLTGLSQSGSGRSSGDVQDCPPDIIQRYRQHENGANGHALRHGFPGLQRTRGIVTSLLPRAVQSFLEAGGNAVQRVDLVIMGVLGLLLLEYDLLRAYFGGSTFSRLRPFGIAIVPLLFGCAIVIVHRWRQFSR